jgi:methionyl-tRNA formyltransferase
MLFLKKKKTMNNENIAFFGTSDRSIPILESLNSNFSLVLCITKKDTLIGRKQETRQTEVKKWAKSKGIEVMEVDSLKGENSKRVLDKMYQKNVGYGVVADFSFMIPPSIIETYKNKLINIHFSLLPKYRGASPVQFALINGDKTTGVTYQLIEREMDKGAIIGQVEYKIGTKQNSKEIYEDLFKISAENLPNILKNYISEKITPILQDDNKATYTYSRSYPKHTYIFKEDAKINWEKPVEVIEREIRAFYPWPISWTTLADLENTNNLATGNIKFKEDLNKQLKIKIFDAEIINDKIMITKLQLEGKNVVNWKDFENGYLKN